MELLSPHRTSPAVSGHVSTEKSAEPKRFVTFFLGQTLYGIEADQVVEVMRPPVLTVLPNCPRSLAGIAALRGEIVAVLDLRHLLGEPDRPWRDASKLILLSRRSGEIQLALPADSVHEILQLSPIPSNSSPHLSGTAQSEIGPVHLIEPRSLTQAIS